VSTRAGLATVELRVENSGPPVEPKAAARLAEPFERLARDADGRGAGLGLSIVRAVGQAHGGSLSIEPRAEGGLVVSVRLPRAGPRDGARPAGQTRASRDSRRAARARA
jgi:signal transduction histidine kinase